jgi:glutathione S-transferase
MLSLHNMPMSGNCYKVRLVAHQLSIPLTLVEYPHNSGKTRTPEFLAKNPNGRTPALELPDGRVLAESNAIIFHLSEGSALIPRDAFARAKMLEWMFFEQYSLEPYIAVRRFLMGYATPEVQKVRAPHMADLLVRGNAALAVMETHLAKQDWFAGGRYSLADVALYAYTHCAGEGGFDLARFPAITTWLSRVAAEPGHIGLNS